MCVSCITNTTCCGFVEDRCVTFCPQEDPCCSRVVDKNCTERNDNCTSLKASINDTIEAQKNEITRAENKVTIAEDEVAAVEFRINQTKMALDESMAKLQEILESTDVTVLAQQYIEKQGVDSIIHIREVAFNAPLPVAHRGVFRGSMEASIKDGPFRRYPFHVDIKMFDNMVHRLANLVFPGIYSPSESTGARKRRSSYAYTGDLVQRYVCTNI